MDYRTPNHYPTDYDARKALPIMTGLLDYFPDACAAVAEVSVIGNEQHNPGEPMHWARGKSPDQINTALRHMVQRGGRDTDGGRHLAKAAWRLLAALQEEIEAEHASAPAEHDLDQPEWRPRAGLTGVYECQHGRLKNQDCVTCGRSAVK